MFSFPELTTRCDTCRRMSIAEAVGRLCEMPQPDGTTCTGTFMLPTKPSAEPTPPPETETITVSLFGVPVTLNVPPRNPFPQPKVLLTERAKHIGRKAFWDAPTQHTGKSLDIALEAAAGVIAADNIDAIARGIHNSIPLLEAIGRRGDAEMCRTILEILFEYIEHLDPTRPPK
jgi:hypothetical protein